ncbi:uncharacterized protein G2W53_027647 [Senna tora]|uniref:Uncharacterized protein n=1 Tax=Senna tora TaxID=362788 RepID=A0A834TH87_9FABA|nr:uncharacterized protein G2W53_027647 [Senna tora]
MEECVKETRKIVAIIKEGEEEEMDDPYL